MRNHKTLLLAVSASLAGMLLQTGASAATIAWNVTANGTWDTSTANWTGDASTYTEGDDVTIALAGGTNFAVTVDRDADGVGNGVDDVAPGSTLFNVGSGRTLTITGGRIMSGSVSKTGAGTVFFSPYNASFGFASLSVTQGKFTYRDSSLVNNSVISVGSGSISLDNGGIFAFEHGQGSAPGVTVTNSFVVGSAGGEINTARRTGNPRTVFSGSVTLNGDLTLSAGSGGNSEPTATYTGTVTLTGGDRAIRGASTFSNNKYPVISGNIVQDASPRQLALAMATTGRQFVISGSANTYSGGTIIESSAGFIRVTSGSSLGTGDVTVQSGGELRVEWGGAVNPSAMLTLDTGADKMALNYTNPTVGVLDIQDMVVAGLVLGGVSQPVGVYSANSHSDWFTGTGEIHVIPEPAALGLLGGLMVLARRQRR